MFRAPVIEAVRFSLNLASVYLDRHPRSTLPVSWLATILQWLTSCSTPILQHWLQEDKLFIQYLKGFLSHTSTHTLSCQCIGYTTIQLHHFWPSEQLSFIIDSTKYWMLCVLLLCKKNNLLLQTGKLHYTEQPLNLSKIQRCLMELKFGDGADYGVNEN